MIIFHLKTYYPSFLLNNSFVCILNFSKHSSCPSVRNVICNRWEIDSDIQKSDGFFLKVTFILSNTTYFHWPLRNLILFIMSMFAHQEMFDWHEKKACGRPDRTPLRLISPTCNLNSPIKKMTTSHTEGVCWKDLFERIRRSSFKNK